MLSQKKRRFEEKTLPRDSRSRRFFEKKYWHSAMRKNKIPALCFEHDEIFPLKKTIFV